MQVMQVMDVYQHPLPKLLCSVSDTGAISMPHMSWQYHVAAKSSSPSPSPPLWLLTQH